MPSSTSLRSLLVSFSCALRLSAPHTPIQAKVPSFSADFRPGPLTRSSIVAFSADFRPGPFFRLASSIVASALYTRLVSFFEHVNPTPSEAICFLSFFLLVAFLFFCIFGCFFLVQRSKSIITDFRSPHCSRIVCVGFESAVFVSLWRCRENISCVSS